MTSITFPCLDCAHFDTHKGLTCAAFSDGIPKELIFGYVPHETPYPGDNGIGFTRRIIDGERFEPEKYEEWTHYSHHGNLYGLRRKVTCSGALHGSRRT